MKRKLTKAYDNMTMPDDCVRRIEQRLQMELSARETGRYTKAVAPAPRQKNGWFTAAAAVCLMLVLSVGGSVLFLRMSRQIPDAPEEALASIVPAETALLATPDDQYALATDFPAAEVEAFAAEIRRNALEGDWEAFAEKVHYPIAIYDKTIGNDGGLVGLTIRNPVKEAFLAQLEQESCTAMFCNWQGICMASGRIWINEVDGQLKITAINDMFGDLVEATDFRFEAVEGGNYAITGYSGTAEEITFFSGYEQGKVTQLGSGSSVIWHGDFVKAVHIPDTVEVVRERAFADCPALEAVYFRGNAPAEAEGVFQGSENVIVYYPEGASGWKESWCGRKTEAYGFGHVSLGTVTVTTRQEQVNQAFLEVLQEKRGFHCEEYQTAYTISQYCRKQSKDVGKTVTMPYFTMADMDRDGVKELILWLDAEGEKQHLILRYDEYDDEDGGMVYCFVEPHLELVDLKKDGTFFSRDLGNRYVESLQQADWVDPQPDQQERLQAKVPARWHSWPCIRPEVVLESYEAASTEEWGEPLGRQYVFFEELVGNSGEADSDRLGETMGEHGFRLTQAEDGTLCIYDPASPGCQLYCMRNEEGSLTSIGYYICNEGGEFQAEIRGLLTDAPEYQLDAHLTSLNSLGRRVSSFEEIRNYFGQEKVYAGGLSDVLQIKLLVHEFASYYFENNKAMMKTYLAEGYTGSVEGYFGKGTPSIQSPLKGIPEPMALGESCTVSLELLDPAEESYFYLTLELVKQKDGWKIRFYGLEK